MSKKLRKQIISVLREFNMDPHNSPLKKQKDRDLVGRFIDRVHSTEFDVGSLPYWSKDGLAKHHNKSECLLALICDVVLAYWMTVMHDIPAPVTAISELDSKLHRLETVYDKYDQLKVLGDAKGYCLFKSQRKDLYEKKETQIIKASEVTDLAKLCEETKPGDKGRPVDVVILDEFAKPEGSIQGIRHRDISPAIEESLPDLSIDDGDMSLGEEQALRGVL